MGMSIPHSILVYILLAIGIKILFLKRVEFIFQWKVNHGPGSELGFSFPCKSLSGFFLISWSKI